MWPGEHASTALRPGAPRRPAWRSNIFRAPALVDQFGMLQQLHGFRHPGQIPNAHGK